MANSKVQLANGTVLIDLTGDTVSPSSLIRGITAHNAAGEKITGTVEEGAGGEYNVISIPDSDGTQHIEITDAEGAVSIVPLTATENKVYTAAAGTAYNPVTVAVPIPTLTLQEKSATPTESSQTITADSDYDGLSSVSVGAIPSTYVGSGVGRKSSADLTVSGATVTAPAGYYAADATKTVASGSAGTPTATKSAVSNNSITVTPSVTNTTGYISGGTKTGTPVSVSAGELVSGNRALTPSTTAQTGIDVTNYETVSVAAIQTETKTASQNGDVTPTSGKYLTKVTVAIPVYDGTVS